MEEAIVDQGPPELQPPPEIDPVPQGHPDAVYNGKI